MERQKNEVGTFLLYLVREVGLKEILHRCSRREGLAWWLAFALKETSQSQVMVRNGLNEGVVAREVSKDNLQRLSDKGYFLCGGA